MRVLRKREGARGSERGGPISCFLACQCSFVLITPAAAAPPARHVSLLFSSFVGRRAVGATDRPTDRPDRFRISRGREGSRLLGVLPTQRATQHSTHAAYIHYRRRRRRLPSLYFYFSGPAPRKGERGEQSAIESKVLEERSANIFCKNSRTLRRQRPLFLCHSLNGPIRSEWNGTLRMRPRHSPRDISRGGSI